MMNVVAYHKLDRERRFQRLRNLMSIFRDTRSSCPDRSECFA